MNKRIYWLALIIITIIGIWLRFWQLDAVPAAFYHDEMDHVFTGQAISIWGTDITGNWSPWQLRPLKTLNYTSEWGPLFHGITQKIFGHGVYQARLTNAIFGIFSVAGISIFAFMVTKKRLVAILCGILMLSNPWHIHISRLGYEATISLFFLVLSIIGLWGIIKNNHSLKFFLIWIVGAVGSYFSYHGAKFTLGVISAVFLLYILKTSITKHTKKYFPYAAGISCILLLLFTHTFVGNNKGLYGDRAKQDTFTLQMAQEMADLERRDRIPFIFDRLLANKFTTSMSELSNRYFFTFDPYRLWLQGVEGGYQFSLVTSGYFGLLILIGLGCHIFFNRKQQNFTLLSLMIFVSPIASVIGSGRQSLFRSSLTYALLILAASWGLYSFYDHAAKKSNQRIWGILFFLIFVFESLWFGLNYFARYPLLTANNHYLSERLASRYLRSPSKPATVVVERDSFSLARGYVFYNNLMNNLTKEEKDQFNNPNSATFTLRQVTITTDCPKEISDDRVWMADLSRWSDCKFPQLAAPKSGSPISAIAIASPLDNGTYFTILNDPVCKTDNIVKSFIKIQSLNDFNVEKINDQDFCQKWIRQL